MFTALLADAPVPRMAAGDQVEEDPVTAYRETSAALLVAFGQSGALDRQYKGPLGTASGAERLQIRLYDLLAHGWDLAHATGQPVDLPDDLVESSVAFARMQLAEQSRDGRFGPPRNIVTRPGEPNHDRSVDADHGRQALFLQRMDRRPQQSGRPVPTSPIGASGQRLRGAYEELDRRAHRHCQLQSAPLWVLSRKSRINAVGRHVSDRKCTARVTSVGSVVRAATRRKLGRCVYCVGGVGFCD